MRKSENICCTQKYIHCRKQKLYFAQNGKCTLHETENICCTKQKICSAQIGKYTLYKTGNIPCTKEKMNSAQNGKYTLHNTENMFCTKRKIFVTQSYDICCTHGREFCSITCFAFSHLCFHKVSEGCCRVKMSSTVFAESVNKLGILRRFPA